MNGGPKMESTGCKFCEKAIIGKFVAYQHKWEHNLGDRGEMEFLDAGVFCDHICLLDYLDAKYVHRHAKA